MALSGTITKSITGRKYQISWSATQSVSNNTSTITCTHKLINDASYSLYVNSRTNTCTVGSSEKSYTSSSISTGGGSTITLGTTTHTVSHDSDGTKKVTISGTFNIQATLSGTYVSSITASASVTLDTIPRSSTITSASNITLGNACSIKWTPASSDFKYKIKFSLGDWYHYTGYISPSTTSAYTYTGYTISGTTTSNNTTIYDELPSSDSGTMTAVLYTYNSSGTQIGSTSSKTFTVTIPSSVKPTVGTITLSPQTYDYLICGKNKLKISVSGCSAGTGSSIKSYTFSGQNISSTTSSTSVTSSSVISPSISGESTTLKYTVTVTDKRGRKSSGTKTITCYNYAVPNFNSFSVYRSNSKGKITDDGTYMKCIYKVTYYSINDTNSIASFSVTGTGSTITSRTVSSTSSSSTNGTITESGYFLIDLNGDTTKTYSVYANITDDYSGSKKSSTVTIYGSSRILNIYPDGTGIAFGKMAESSNLFESKWPVKINGEINFGTTSTQGSLYTGTNDSHVNIIYLTTGVDTSGGEQAGVAIHETSFYVPYEKNSGVLNLGSSGRKWNQLYAANSTISTSDRNKKDDIEDMSDVQEQLFNQLKPVTYKIKAGSSGRTHYGFIAQDVEDALANIGLDGTAFAGFCKDIKVDDNGKAVLDENKNNIYDYALRYSEFIALNTYMIQKLQNKITELEAEIAELKQN